MRALLFMIFGLLTLSGETIVFGFKGSELSELAVPQSVTVGWLMITAGLYTALVPIYKVWKRKFRPDSERSDWE